MEGCMNQNSNHNLNKCLKKEEQKHLYFIHTSPLDIKSSHSLCLGFDISMGNQSAPREEEALPASLLQGKEKKKKSRSLRDFRWKGGHLI